MSHDFSMPPNSPVRRSRLQALSPLKPPKPPQKPKKVLFPQQLEGCSLQEQLNVLKMQTYKPWKIVPLATQRYLIEKLARKNGLSVYDLVVKHFFLGMLFTTDFSNFTKKELIAIYAELKKMGVITNRDQKVSRDILKKDPASFAQEFNPSGLSLNEAQKGEILATLQKTFQDPHLEEINANLSGLYGYYFDLSERENQPVIDFMLKKMGFAPFEKLPLQEQLNILKKQTNISWEKVPLATQRYLIEKLARKYGLSVYDLKTKHFSPGMICAEDFLNFTQKEQGVIYAALKKMGIIAHNTASRDILEKAPSSFIQEFNPPDLNLNEAQKGEILATLQKTFQDPWLEEINSSLWGLYSNYCLNRSERKDQPVIDFMLEKLGFGSPALNAAGQLFTGRWGKNKFDSWHLLFNKTREIVTEWQTQNPSKSLLQISKNEIKEILDSSPLYEGFKHKILMRGLGLSYLDAICLAYQHYPLDQLVDIKTLPTEAQEELEGFNFLGPDLFTGYFNKNYKTAIKESAEVKGQYSSFSPRFQELPLLIRVLEESRQLLTRSSANPAENSLEEETFDTYWLDQQIEALSAIFAKIERGEPLSPALYQALGQQEYFPNPQPGLADPKVTSGMQLNPAQDLAARMILEESNPFVMVHGPAGSGKTHLLAKVIAKLVQDGFRVGYFTPTHQAADVFMERIDKDASFENLPVGRIGSQRACDEKFSDIAKKYWLRDKQAREIFNRKKLNGGMLMVGTIASGVNFLAPANKPLREKLFSEKREGIDIFHNIQDYDIVFLDENSMVSKAESYAILDLAQRGVVIGDHIQLNPFPLPPEIAGNLGLNDLQKESVQRNLLEQLMFDNYPHVLLNTNYRAINPAMIVLASRIFYDEQILVNHASPFFKLSPEERIKKYPPDALSLVNTAGLPPEEKEEQRDRETFYGNNPHSFYNPLEARLAVGRFKYYLKEGFSPEEIKFISPYDAQLGSIQSLLEREFPDLPPEYYRNNLKTFRTVQSDESDCIIVSFVRSNDKEPPETGFVGEYHQANVGLTRARERMTLIGDWETLKKTGEAEKIKEEETQDKLSLQTRHIFEELENQLLELQEEGFAKIENLQKAPNGNGNGKKRVVIINKK